jgi:uncharacterized peroxidase-related enzyme
MTWIATVADAAATGRLRTLYDRIRGPGGAIDNIMKAHSLRPHTMEGHMALYKNVLHHSANTVPEWVLELLGVQVSALNDCGYCVEHHFAGLRRLLGDDARAAAILRAIEAGDPDAAPVGPRERAAMRYARRLTRDPGGMIEADVAALREAGCDDGAILEINQVVAYFAYANRTVLGLGCTTEGDAIGLSPANAADPDDWGHR